MRRVALPPLLRLCNLRRAHKADEDERDEQDPGGAVEDRLRMRRDADAVHEREERGLKIIWGVSRGSPSDAGGALTPSMIWNTAWSAAIAPNSLPAPARPWTDASPDALNRPSASDCTVGTTPEPKLLSTEKHTNIHCERAAAVAGASDTSVCESTSTANEARVSVRSNCISFACCAAVCSAVVAPESVRSSSGLGLKREMMSGITKSRLTALRPPARKM